jgi:serine/threonine protein kinase
MFAGIANIFMDENGDIVLGDFGLAHDLIGYDRQPLRYQSKYVLVILVMTTHNVTLLYRGDLAGGTPDYRAPELVHAPTPAPRLTQVHLHCNPLLIAALNIGCCCWLINFDSYKCIVRVMYLLLVYPFYN